MCQPQGVEPCAAEARYSPVAKPQMKSFGSFAVVVVVMADMVLSEKMEGTGPANCP